MKLLKLTILIFVIVFNFNSLKAEYQGDHLTFEIQLKNKKIHTGYAQIPKGKLNLDSLDNTKHLLEVLTFWLDLDSGYVEYFKESVSYNFTNPYSGFVHKVFQLSNRIQVHPKEVFSIQVKQVQLMSYTLSLGCSLKPKDSLWFQNPHTDFAQYGSEYCSYFVYVYEKSDKIDSVFSKMNEESEKTNRMLELLQGQQNNEAALRKLNDDYNLEISQHLTQLCDTKVVIVVLCDS